jgi:serine/threonine-protein kinase
VRSKHPEDSGSTDIDVEAARKYHALMELGRGGTAVVSAGIARGIGGFTKLVVLKNIKEEFLSDRDTLRMFVNEARLSARMNHPNVVQVYEVYRKHRLPVIVMEYLDGQSLARVQPRAFADPSYSPELFIAILCRVLAGLSYAHSLADYDGSPLQIVHRDVSPHNVMVTYDGQVKLVDFGIAKLSSRSDDTKTGVIKGKIAYMAPEQLEGGTLDHRSDLFAVGVMLWEAIAGQRMWGARSDAEIVRRLVLDELPSLSSVRPSADPELIEITERALAVQPEARYATAAEFQAALEAYLERRGVIVRQQDIGDLVSHTCADLRASASERLQAELAQLAASTPDWDDALRSFDKLSTPLPESARPSRFWLGFGALALAGASATGVYVYAAGRTAPVLAGGPSLAPAAAPEPVKPAEPMIQLSVSVMPEGASVFLDGERLATLPSRLKRPKDDAEHELRVEAEGYEPALRRIVFDADVALAVVLMPLPPVVVPSELPSKAEPSVATKKRPRRPPPVKAPAPALASEPTPAPEGAETPAAEPSSAVKPACDPPYYIGSDGVKHYRPECL